MMQNTHIILSQLVLREKKKQDKLNAFFFHISFLPGMQSICCPQLEEEPLESSFLEDSSQSHLQVFSAHVSLPSPS